MNMMSVILTEECVFGSKPGATKGSQWQKCVPLCDTSQNSE